MNSTATKMASAEPSNYTFLPPVKSGRPIREKELELAQIRAHAARISHQRKSWVKVQQQLKRQQDKQHEEERVRLMLAGNNGTYAAPKSRELLLLLHGFHGSSDPFDAYPVKITPETNRIIRYARDVMLPQIFTPPFFRRLTIGAPSSLSYDRSDKVIGGSNFLLNMKVFSDMSEGAALGWLCGHIPAIVRNSPGTMQELTVLRLNMRAKSMKLMREKLTNRSGSSAESLLALRLHIRTLYEAECMAGDTAAARAHMNILLRLEDPITDELLRASHLMVMMFNTTELACKKLERTLLPFGEWTRKTFAPLWTLCSPFLPVSPETVNKAHPSVKIPLLREAMIRLRYCLWFGQAPLPFGTAQERLGADMIFAWTATQLFNDLGVLMNLYMDIIEGEISFRSEGRRWAEACMVLTQLHMVRKCVHEAIIEGGVDLREASHVIMPRLERDLKMAMESMTQAEEVYYQEALFWMLYAGALHEQRRRRRKGPIGLDRVFLEQPWFIGALAMYAGCMKITSWDQAKAVLQKFVYDKYLEPDGHIWFEEVISARGPAADMRNAPRAVWSGDEDESRLQEVPLI